MTRLSAYFLPTEKQAPADAEALSHKLLVRAGMVRQVGAGLWSWLPAGWKVHQKVVQIGPGLFRLQDRRGAPMVLAMTHEEIVTMHVAQVVRSYRDLPLILYHFQVKERDEPRPRAGVLRTREFVMKDSYSFDRDEPGLNESYEKHVAAENEVALAEGYAANVEVASADPQPAEVPAAGGEPEAVDTPGLTTVDEV